MDIKGKVNTAVCYASVIEKEAIEQIRRMCDYEFTKDSKIRIMPDVHAGAGCTIGTTMTITDKAVPNVVGVDIGCGMLTVPLGNTDIDYKEADKAAYFIPSGMNVWDSPLADFDLSELRCFKNLKNLDWLKCSLGTLGGGNHFIEIDEDENGGKYLVIHSGSRNLGKQVAEHYQKLAIELHSGKDELIAKKNQLIKQYKEQGKEKEIESALKDIEQTAKSNIPDDLCYVYGSSFEDYLHDVEICQEFARRNREMMADILIDKGNLGNEYLLNNAFHTIHNYIDTDEMILRKGAIAAHKGEKVLIPINMRDGSILAVGRGNPDWNYSAPHGAGRIMSRRRAFDSLDIEEYRKQMSGIYTTSVNEKTLDEAPMAYKSMESIIGIVEESVEIIGILKPRYNFKASE